MCHRSVFEISGFCFGKCIQPFGDSILVVAADYAGGNLFEFCHRVGNGIGFVGHFKHVHIIFSVTEYNDFLTTQIVFQLPDGIGFGCSFRHDLKPLVCGINIFLKDAVILVSIFTIQRFQFFRGIDAGDVENVSCGQLLFCSYGIVAAVVFSGVQESLRFRGAFSGM